MYVSRLRGLLGRAGDGAAIESRPPGYVLRIPPGALDVERMEKLIEAARETRDAGDSERAHRLFTQALDLWRGPSLADVSLLSSGSIEAERLEEERLSATTERADVELALGRHGSVVEELGPLVRRHPFHERLRALLMLALYRSGRQADALEAYQETRSELAAELGLRPGPELRDLAARIIRQEPSLGAPSNGPQAAAAPAPLPEQVPPRRRRGMLFAAIAVAAVAILAALLTGLRETEASPSAGATPAATPHGLRVALAVEGGVGDVDDFPLTSKMAEGVERASRTEDLESATFDAGVDTDRFRSTLEGLTKEDFDLVVAFGSGMDQAIAQVAADARDTHFVLLDSSIEGGPLHGLDNVTGVVFAEHEAAYLAGYLAGLLEREDGPRLNDEKVVSVVGGHRIPPVERFAAGFAAGARSALPGVQVLVDFANTWDDQERCAAIARRQIDAGSDIVFPVAGACSFGALQVANIQGVWGIGVDGDLGYLGPHVLLSVVKRFDRASELVVKWFAQGRLAKGRTVVFDLRNNGVGLTGIAPSVPPSVRARVAEAAASIRAGDLEVPSLLD